MFFIEFLIYLVLGTFGFLFTLFLLSLDKIEDYEKSRSDLDNTKSKTEDILLLKTIFITFLFSMILWFCYEIIN